MSKAVSKLALAAGIVLAMAFTFSCSGSGESAFVGKWVTEDGSSAPSGLPDNLELFKDGTGIIEGISISWKVENKRFVISSSLQGSAYDYEISGKKLTLTDDEGEKAIYVKPQKGKTLTDETKENANEIGPAAGTWIKLQQAYIVEFGEVGDCPQIGYTPPGASMSSNNGATTIFTYECGISQDGNAYWIAKNRVDIDKCKAGNNWIVNMNKKSGEIVAKQPDDKNCAELTPNFNKLQ